MARISFNLAAKCDKAGRSQNQDNYWLCPDLSKINDSFDNIIGNDKDVVLSDKGALLVVADGMGGMNAGEKASELVIKGVQKGFSNIPETILGNDEQMLSFISDVIVESDKSVKEYAKLHREAEGLGSTIVLLWLWGEKAYCGWCGDSRIYRYNPNNELVRLSHDHSYVQELVDNRKIEPEEAFDHPDGNIVTRALGDNGEKASPELMVYDVFERDVFLLCSDGLCGLLQDKKIEEIISFNCSSTKDALAALWQAGDSSGWSDNATIELLCVVGGGKHPRGVAVGYPDKRKPIENKNDKRSKQDTQEHTKEGIERFLKPPYLYIIAAIALLFLGFVIFRHCSSNPKPEQPEKPEKQNEFIVTEPIQGGQQGGQQSGQQGGQQSGQQGGHQGGRQGGQQNGQQGGQQGNQQSGQQGGQQGNQQSGQQGGQQGNQQSGQQGGQQGNQQSGQQGGQQGNQQSGQQGGQQGNQQSGQQGGQQGNQQSGQQGGQQGNQQSGYQGNHQGEQQVETEHIQTVSDDYIRMLNGVWNDDYSIVLTMWNQVKLRGYMTTEESARLDDFVSNVQQLKNNRDYTILDARTRQIIDNNLMPLSKDIRDNKQSIRIISVTPDNGSRPSFQNHPGRRRQQPYL